MLMSPTVESAASQHPLPEGNVFSYGTAGFRTRGDLLDGVCFRVGALAVVRSAAQALVAGVPRAGGIMITASHNPELDNGVKIVDASGGMLDASWETHATAAANACTAHDLRVALDAAVMALCPPLQTVRALAEVLGEEGASQVHVIVGRDTRLSSPLLAKAARDGVIAVATELFGASATDALSDLGIVTTPQLHFAVRCLNRGESQNIQSYYEIFAGAFAAAVSDVAVEAPSVLFVDGANGVGAQAAAALSEALRAQNCGLELQIINDGSAEGDAGTLNLSCGADFVKTRQRQPEYGVPAMPGGKRFASLDGDADRIIYWALSDDGTFDMLDGDKIAVLIAGYIQEELGRAALPEELKLGVVQTAYANGASTRYITETLKVQVAFTPTGVKYLHHAAEAFDVGVYFEANGHGTVLFSEHYESVLAAVLAEDDNRSKEEQNAARRLANLPKLVNQAIGDALSDMLFVEAILRRRGWTLHDWSKLYADAPNRLLAQKVPDRTIFNTTDAERRLTTPVGLQVRIDAAASARTNGRSFVRPSGTEDVVRIYAEAATRDEADELAAEVAQLVEKVGQQ